MGSLLYYCVVCPVFPSVAARDLALSAGNGDIAIAVMAQFRVTITDRLWSESLPVCEAKINSLANSRRRVGPAP